MPLPINPNKTFRYILKSDRDSDIEPKVTFIYRYLTGKEQMEVSDLLESIEKERTSRHAIEVAFKSATIGLIGWENIPVSFDAEKLSEVINFQEAFELAYMTMQGISIEDKKKLESPSDSNTAESAPAAKG